MVIQDYYSQVIAALEKERDDKLEELGRLTKSNVQSMLKVIFIP